SHLNPRLCTNLDVLTLVDGVGAGGDGPDVGANPLPDALPGVDNDGDGFFGSQLTATQCTNPGGYAMTAPVLDDCDDADDGISPDTVWYLGVDDDGRSFEGRVGTA